MPDVYVRGQFYTQVQMDRATNSSYADYDKEILLPREEMEHVLTCVYRDIPGEISLPFEVILAYITPVNDVSDLIVRGSRQLIIFGFKATSEVLFHII